MANMTDITIIFKAYTKERIKEIKEIIDLNNSDSRNFEIGIILDRELLGYKFLVLKTTSKWDLEKSNVEELFGSFHTEKKYPGVFSIFIGCEVDGDFTGMNSYIDEDNQKVLFYPESDYGDESEMFDSVDFELPDEILDVLGVIDEVYVAVWKKENDFGVLGIAKTKELIIAKIINDLKELEINIQEEEVAKYLSTCNSYYERKTEMEYLIEKTEKA